MEKGEGREVEIGVIAGNLASHDGMVCGLDRELNVVCC